ncbi:hypothetical protein B0H13DRAFT_2339052 [Mycena leptocephala]|nr:hypothetical protein B0H13DRAFT_2339052 [Mycena leptocephala]
MSSSSRSWSSAWAPGSTSAANSTISGTGSTSTPFSINPTWTGPTDPTDSPPPQVQLRGGHAWMREPALPALAYCGFLTVR